MQSPGLSLFMGAGCTETRHAMLGAREVARPRAAPMPQALRVQARHCSLAPDRLTAPGTEVREGSALIGLAQFQD